MDCIFCKIAAGEIPAKLVHEGPEVVAFRDLHPQAPTHILVIPRRHIATVNELEEGDAGLIGRLFLAAKEIAKTEGVADKGYRLLINTNRDAGQTVFHVHLHLLAGRPLGWPPG